MALAAHALRGRSPSTRNREDASVPLREHLVELRKRLLLVAVGIALGCIAGWYLYEPLFAVFQDPIRQAAAASGHQFMLTFSTVTSSLDVRVQVSLVIGLVVTAPWTAYQAIAFAWPGLKRRERFAVVAFLAAGLPLFLAGVTVAWLIIPSALSLFSELAPAGTATLVNADVYFAFVMRMAAAFGAAFLLPLAMVLLTRIGLVGGSAWLSHWRWSIVAATVFAAVATPTGDVPTMLALATPIAALYLAATAICLLHDRRLARSIERGTSSRLIAA